MSPGSSTESHSAFSHIGLRENSAKHLNQVTCPDRESNPGHLVSRPDALTCNVESKSVCVHTGNTNKRRQYQQQPVLKVADNRLKHVNENKVEMERPSRKTERRMDLIRLPCGIPVQANGFRADLGARTSRSEQVNSGPE
ncbi:hypothetical protein ANN_23475 [Periplaneta americana]|uniref:Uncharacterized protein n=1 Tax=Periplaneta americana TaxID=6978 RepID=A0ABQ8SL70_PERAM|nr:hypothetical protein ANN_23475 [Periplaneta americana]